MTDTTDGLQWRKADASGDHGQCVELAEGENGVVYLRDSKNPNGNVLSFTRAEIAAFLKGFKEGEFDDLI